MSRTALNQPPISDKVMWDVWLSHMRFPLLAFADEIGFFERISQSNGLTLDQLRSDLALRPRGVEILTSYSAAEGLLELKNDKFTLADLAKTFLLKSSPLYWGGMFTSWRDYDLYREIKSAMIEGNAERVHTTRWKHDLSVDDVTSRFLGAMQSHSQCCAMHLAETGAFIQSKKILDIGGGSGCFSIEAIRARPLAEAAIAELPSVLPVTSKLLQRADIGNRIKVLPLDMFNEIWPRGYDTVFLSNILHDWSLSNCSSIVGAAFEALPSGGRILIHEVLMNDDFTGPLAAAIFSAVMMIRTEGRQWTAKEITTLLEEAGFRSVSITPGLHHFSLVEGSKP